MKKAISLMLINVFLPGIVLAAPAITGVSGILTNGSQLTVSGSGFLTMNGEIISWDNFDNQTLGNVINNSFPIIGPAWTTIYGYNGLGARFDNTHVHSGSSAAHIDWGYAPENSIRAFGWAGQGPYSQLYITYWRYMEGNYTTSNPTCNHKQFYLFGNNGDMPQGMVLIPARDTRWGFYNNVGAQQPAGSYEQSNNIFNPTTTWSDTDNEFQRWEIWTKLNEPWDCTQSVNCNGEIKIWHNSILKKDRNDYRHRFVDGLYDDFRLGNMATEFEATAKAWFDDLYIATTQARVEIGNASTFDSCTHREIQIPSAWSDNSVTLTANQGSFNNGDTVYLYVVDQNGAVNASGYPVTFGSAGAGDTTAPSSPAGLMAF